MSKRLKVLTCRTLPTPLDEKNPKLEIVVFSRIESCLPNPNGRKLVKNNYSELKIILNMKLNFENGCQPVNSASCIQIPTNSTRATHTLRFLWHTPRRAPPKPRERFCCVAEGESQTHKRTQVRADRRRVHSSFEQSSRL